LKDMLAAMRPADIAEFLDQLNAKNTVIVFRLLPKDLAADVFSHIPSEKQAAIYMLTNENELAETVNDLFFDDKIDFLEEMPANVVKKILKNSSEAERKLINQFLQYPDGSAGGLMTIEYVDLRKQMTVTQSLDRIRATALDKETVYTCYCIDSYRKLEGTVSLKDLVIASPDVLVDDIMQKDVLSVNTHEDQEHIAALFKKYDLICLPVVDNEKRLVGIITVDDVVDVIDRENTEDFYLMAAVHGGAKKDKLLQVSIPTAIRFRLPWLIITLFGGILAGGVIGFFEETLAAVLVLAVFIPVIMDMGGDVGIQTSTIIIRGLATGDINKKNVWATLMREILIGISMGVICGIVVGVAGEIWQGVPMLGVAVGGAMITTITVASFLGAFLPILFNRIGVDPAVVSGPLITTIKDITGLIIYFAIASLVMGL
ncbi:MAG TPA: magnesium transporter, partial [Candidatus Limnocylindrales bacterium]|nr:magnesium transporter [Candidatus Limnocylindrales bacterium]